MDLPPMLERVESGSMGVPLWLVVPCYNEAQRLDVAAYTHALNSQPTLHLVLVNDGSDDDTLHVLHALARSFPTRVDVLDQQPNRGKSEAVRVGMLRAMEKPRCYAGYFDADLATPLNEATRFARVLDDDPETEIVLGARVALLGRKITRKASRHYLGRVFATVASLVLGLVVYDTQCGAKLFRVNAATRGLFDAPFGSRWIFDVELLARYLGSTGSARGLFEVPVKQWTDVGESRVRLPDFLRAMGEMVQIQRRYPKPAGTGLLASLLAFAKYIGAGGIGTGVHYLILLSFVEFSQLRASVASALGALAGSLTNYLLNYHFTFASTSSHARTLPRFLCVAALSVALTAGGMSLATERLGMHYLLAQLVCSALVLVVGFAFNRAWTFAVRPPAEGTSDVSSGTSGN